MLGAKGSEAAMLNRGLAQVSLGPTTVRHGCPPSVSENHFHQWTAIDQRLDAADLLPVPVRFRRAHDRKALCGLGNQPGTRREVCPYRTLEVQGKFRVRGQVGKPPPWSGRSGNDDLSVDIVEPDLHAPRTARSPARGRYVDHHLFAPKSIPYSIFRGEFRLPAGPFSFWLI